MIAIAVTQFAHQGGWDEILLVAGPIAVIVGLLMLAKRRASAARTGLDARNLPPADGQAGTG